MQRVDMCLLAVKEFLLWGEHIVYIFCVLTIRSLLFFSRLINLGHKCIITWGLITSCTSCDGNGLYQGRCDHTQFLVEVRPLIVQHPTLLTHLEESSLSFYLQSRPWVIQAVSITRLHTLVSPLTCPSQGVHPG